MHRGYSFPCGRTALEGYPHEGEIIEIALRVAQFAAAVPCGFDYGDLIVVHESDDAEGVGYL